MSDVSTWSNLAAGNTGSAPDFLAEACAPSAVNDAFREMQAAIRRQLEAAQWFNWGLTHTRLTSSDFSIAGDYRTLYEVGRRVKMAGSADAVATVSAVSYSAPNTTVTVAENNVPGTLSTVAVSILSVANSAVPTLLSTDLTTTGTLTGGTVVSNGNFTSNGSTAANRSLLITNTNAGTTAAAQVAVFNNGGQGLRIQATSTGYTGPVLTGGPMGNAGHVFTDAAIPISFGTNNVEQMRLMNGGGLAIPDGITAPATVVGLAILYVDSADGDLKVVFGDGTVKTIVVDT